MMFPLFLPICMGLTVLAQVSANPRGETRSSQRRELPGSTGDKGKSGKGASGNGPDCSAYAILCARGTREPQSGSMTYRGLVNQVKATVPGGIDHEVHYSAAAEYTVGPIQGMEDGVAWMNKQAQRCPKQVFVLVGYSKGAMVMTRIMTKPRAPLDKVVAVALFGSPDFLPGQPQNKCGAKTAKGVAAAMGVTMPPKFAPLVFDCCKVGDNVCQTGAVGASHLAYAGSPSEKEAAQFVIGKLKQRLGQGGGAKGGDGGKGGHSDKGGHGDKGGRGNKGSQGDKGSGGAPAPEPGKGKGPGH